MSLVAVEIQATQYPDVTKVCISGEQVATVCGNPKKSTMFQVVSTNGVRGGEFWTGFDKYEKAIDWIQESLTKANNAPAGREQSAR